MRQRDKISAINKLIKFFGNDGKNWMRYSCSNRERTKFCLLGGIDELWGKEVEYNDLSTGSKIKSIERTPKSLAVANLINRELFKEDMFNTKTGASVSTARKVLTSSFNDLAKDFQEVRSFLVKFLNKLKGNG